jgi:hypothetical protein
MLRAGPPPCCERSKGANKNVLVIYKHPVGQGSSKDQRCYQGH